MCAMSEAPEGAAFSSVVAVKRLSSMAHIPIYVGMQAVATGFRDSHFHNVTDFAGLFINYHRQQPWRTADLLAGLAARLLQQQVDLAANQRNGEFALLFRKQRLQALQPLVLVGLGDLA